MYSQEDMKKAKAEMTKRFVINGVLLLILAGTSIVGMVLRLMWLAMGGFAVMLCVTYGYFMLKTGPWYNYYRFIRDMFNGRSRETEGEFVECAQQARLADGVSVHDFWVRTEESEEPALFYWDDDKTRPDVQPGTRVKILSYGRFVRDFSVMTEA